MNASLCSLFSFIIFMVFSGNHFVHRKLQSEQRHFIVGQTRRNHPGGQFILRPPKKVRRRLQFACGKLAKRSIVEPIGNSVTGLRELGLFLSVRMVPASMRLGCAHGKLRS